MRRRVILLASWLAATAVAVGVALAGVQLVAQRVVEPLPVAIAEVSVEPARDGPATESASPETSPSPDGTAPADGSSASPGGPGSGDGTGSSPPPRSSPSPPSPDDAPRGDEGSEEDDASDDDDDDPSSPAGSQTETRTYSLVGGTVTVEFSATSVRVVQATPHDGFTRDVDQKDATEVRVEFRSEDHRSRLDAWWADGPRAEVDEDADD